MLPGDDQIFEQITQPFVPTQRPWYQKAIDAERPVWTEPYEFFITSGGQSRRDRLIEAVGIALVVPYCAEFGLETDAEADFIMDAAADKTLLDSRMQWLSSLTVLSVILMLLAAIAQRINRSMRRLSQASQAIADGNLNQSVSGSFIQEINTTL